MRTFTIADRRRTASGCPTVFEGTIVVAGLTETFIAHYRSGRLTLTVAGVDLRVPVELSSDGVCSWPEIVHEVGDALHEHFNSQAYADRLEWLARCAA